MALAGTPAASERSRRSQRIIVLPVLPVVPVLKKIVPLENEVLALSIRQESIVLLVASLMKVKVGFEVSVLRKRRNWPLPLIRPSKVTRSAPFNRIIPLATEPEIVLKVPSDTMVRV